MEGLLAGVRSRATRGSPRKATLTWQRALLVHPHSFRHAMLALDCRVASIQPETVAVEQIDPDDEVIGRVLAGSKDAFSILIARYSDPLYRHALGMTGSPDVAEDIL
jgi:hypothetical protein